MFPAEVQFLAEVQHYARDPHWTWYILFYFFFAGIAGGCYLMATLFRLRGEPSDEPVARLGYYTAFVALLLCAPLLIVDLGQPLRFWHMMISTTPGEFGLNFKYISPMSVGVWGLLGFNAFAAISFVECLVRDGKLRLPLAQRAVALLDGQLGTVVMIVGSVFATFIAGYTGVLLAVSNQPIWSDTWTLGGLFLASGLSSAAAVLMLLSRYRRGAEASSDVLHISERLFTLLELVMIVVFVLSLIGTGALERTFGFPWILLWLIAFASLVPGLAGLVTQRLAVADHGDGTVSAHATPPTATSATATLAHATTTASLAVPVLVLVGVLCLRAAIIFPVHHW
jgi:formate-dependent nitrite reductase membrane component NrfD